jgi:hypothetical protein
MKRTFAIGLVVLLVLGVLLTVFLAGRKPVAPWFSAVSSGNGYDALVQAAGQMNGQPSDETAEGSAFVKANERVFELVNAAIELPFEVPLTMYSVTNSLLTDLSSFKAIARALRARGKDAEERGANGEARTNYTSIIQLGQRIEHGPIIALLVGIAIEKIGLDALEKAAVGLTPAQRKEVADQIESFDRERLAFSEVALREEHFARQVTGNPIKLLVARFYIRPGLIKAEQKREKLSADFQHVAKELRSSAR